MPAGAGTPRYENWGCWLGKALECQLRHPQPLLWIPAPYRGTGHAFDRENDDAGALAHSQAAKAHFRTNRSCRLVPAHQGMKSRSCGLVQRISTADSATPHADPSGGQAPALHFLIPPSTIGLQFGTFRPWRAGIEVDWRAHPGSESGTCFHSNRSSRLPPAHQGMRIGGAGWGKRSSVICATHNPSSGFRPSPE